jgi:hypothetical protein
MINFKVQEMDRREGKWFSSEYEGKGIIIETVTTATFH